MQQQDQTRELLLYNNQLVYQQNDKINQIISTLETTNDLASDANLKLNQQGQKIELIANNNKEIQKDVRRTDKTVSEINRREFCHKLMLYVIIFLLSLCILVLVIWDIVKPLYIAS